MPGNVHGCCSVMMQADKNAGLARESALLEGKCQLKAALSSALESKAEVEAALQTARLDQQRLQQEVCATHIFSLYCCGPHYSQQAPSNFAGSMFSKTSATTQTHSCLACSLVVGYPFVGIISSRGDSPIYTQHLS